jgi:FdhD protein
MDAGEKARRAGVTERAVVREGVAARDRVAVEEPLEIRVAGDALAITMRTPGDDARLAAGFLFAEGIISALDDLGALAHCGRPGTEGSGNVIDAVPAGGVVLDVERAQASRRGTLTTSACGVCGRRSVDDLLALCQVLPPGPSLSRSTLLAGMAQLKDRQPIFAETGGTHAAAALALDGSLLATHEDVGRHNAVDKVVGALLYAKAIGARRDSSAISPIVLVVSGRASFEIVQKAAVARIPIVASVSAASSLAIDLAERVGITLAGFVRGERLNLYTHPERVTP